jgi:hypothetical protein
MSFDVRFRLYIDWPVVMISEALLPHKTQGGGAANATSLAVAGKHTKEGS